MDDCIFCQIIKGQIPSYKIYEDDLFFGFLDIRPLNPGHVLLIPKRHYRWINDIPEFEKMWTAARQIAIASQTAVKSDFISYLTMGMDVPHAHLHIIPRFENDVHRGKGILATEIQDIPKQQLQQIARDIQTYLKGVK